MAEIIFDQLKAICSTKSDDNIENTPLLITLDPFQEEIERNILIYKIKLHNIISTTSSTLSNHSEFFIRRVFIKSNECLNYRYIGWILNEDILICMICSNEFTLLNRRHHCRVCGDIICVECSKNTIYINEIYNYGPVKVCDCCYYGQVRIHSFLSSFLLS